MVKTIDSELIGGGLRLWFLLVACAAYMRYRPAQLVCAYLLGLSVASCQIQLSRRFASKIVFVSMYVEEIVFAKQSRGIDVS